MKRLSWLVWVIGLGLACFAIATQAGAQQVIVQDNVRIALNLTSPKAQSQGQNPTNTLLNLQFSDVQTRQPINVFKPRVWLDLRRSEQVAAETSCVAKARSFLSGQLATRADIDLNSYLLLTLNQDNSITFIDPQVSWSSSKLAAIVQLPAQGLDWVLTSDGKWLYVTMPKADAVALIDVAEHRLLQTIATGAGSQPTRIVLAPDEQTVWVGLDGAEGVAVINTGAAEVHTIKTGAGRHQLSFTPDSLTALVTNTQGNSVSLIDGKQLTKKAEVAIANTPLALTWSVKAERFYVAALNDSQLSVVDPAQAKVDAQIEVGRGTSTIAADPQGRYVWVVNQLEAKVYVIDTAINQIVAFAKLNAEPDQIAFSPEYAYFRSLGSEKFTLINRKQLAHLAVPMQELSVTQIQAGEQPPVKQADAIGVAQMLAALPDGNGMLVANAPGKTIYYYVEGMMVPMGTLDNYRRVPMGLKLLDRSLRKIAPGNFTAAFAVPKSGNYDVVVQLERPATSQCFTAQLNAALSAATAEHQPKIKVNFSPPSSSFAAQESVWLRFSLTEAASGKPVSGVRDARLLVFEPPGLWQKREWLQDMGDGNYQTALIFPYAGTFKVLLEAKSQGVEFTPQSSTSVTVGEPRSAPSHHD